MAKRNTPSGIAATNEKGIGQNGNHWVSFGSGATNRSRPTDWQLLALYGSSPIAYFAVNTNARAVSGGTLRLYVTRKDSTVAEKSFKTKPVAPSKVKYLRSRAYQETLAGEVVEEVTDHPLLDLLYNVNEEINGSQLWWLTDLYLETLGRSYWKLDRNPVTGVPDKLWILPSQNVQPVYGAEGFATSYKYRVNQVEQALNREEVISFLFNSPAAPYTLSQSPLMAAYGDLLLSANLTDYENALISNRARPDALLIPKGDSVAPETIRKLRKDFEDTFRGQGNGRVFVADEALSYHPLSFTALDLGSVAIDEKTVRRALNAFEVPEAFYTKDSNRANIDGAIYKHAKGAVTHRLLLIEQQLNATLVPMFGDERLFVCFDNPVPEDEASERAERELKLKEITFVAQQGKLTDEEIRAVADLPPLTPAEESETNEANEGAAENAPVEAAPAAPSDTTPVAGAEQEIVTTEAAVLNGAQIQAAIDVVTQVQSGTLPRDSALGILETLFNLTPERAEQILGSAGEGPARQLPELVAVNEQVGSGKIDRATAINLVAQAYGLAQEEAKKLVIKPKAQGCACGSAECSGSTHEKKAQRRGGAVKVNRAAEKRLALILQKHFKKQEAYFLGKVEKDFDQLVTKANAADLPDEFVGIDEWDEELADDVKPVIEILATDGGQQLEARVGASPDAFSVVPAEIDKAVNKASLKFSKATNGTTVKNLNTALKQLRQELKDGLLAGDSVRELRSRVQSVFENASNERAELIAHTEAQRAVHEGLRIAAKASGVVKGFKFLVSDDACPLCLELKDEEIGLEDTFVDNGYDDSMLPIHPGCRCTVTEILDDSDEGDND